MVQIAETNNKKKYLKLTFITALIAAIIFAGIFLVLEQRAKSAEKKEFLANKAQIEEISKKITTQYPPDEEKHKESCRYQSAKYERGDLYCRVGVELVYSGVSVEDANTIANGSAVRASTLLRPHESFGVREKSFLMSENPNSLQGLLGNLPAPKDCSISFIYDGGKESKRDLTGTISCNRISKAEHFPLEKY